MNDFDRQIRALFEELGISRDFQRRLRMPLHLEESRLVPCEPDMFGRPQKMTRETRNAWASMKLAASAEAVELQLVSAFRSVDYQCTLIRNKLAKGVSIDEILTVNAPPGYSEHHTGRALDLSTPGIEPLTLAFEESTAFTWLKDNGRNFGFRLSYPRDNPHGIIYEPWHWAWQPDGQT